MAVETPSRRNDALSVRTYANTPKANFPFTLNQYTGQNSFRSHFIAIAFSRSMPKRSAATMAMPTMSANS